MSIVFHKTLHSVNVCPGCETPCEALPDKDVECVSCGMMFRTIDELVKDKFARPLAAEPEGHSFRGIERQPIPMTMTAKRKRTEDDGDDEVRLFRRVRVISPRRTSHMRWKVWEIKGKILQDCGIGFCTLDRSLLVSS